MKREMSRLATDAEVEELRQSIARGQHELAELREQVPELFSGEGIAKQLQHIKDAKSQEATKASLTENVNRPRLGRIWRMRLTWTRA
ncbi:MULTISPECIES: hypothetical protein [Burkholderia]|nr:MULTISPECIES: hypothetical protein [Burkholderia]MCA8010114.1 hypothetical protein [Burkholderia cenocepacia]